MREGDCRKVWKRMTKGWGKVGSSHQDGLVQAEVCQPTHETGRAFIANEISSSWKGKIGDGKTCATPRVTCPAPKRHQSILSCQTQFQTTVEFCVMSNHMHTFVFLFVPQQQTSSQMFLANVLNTTLSHGVDKTMDITAL